MIVSILKDEEDQGVFATLPGHEGLVTCIQFLREDAFASADDKGVVHCWRYLEHQARETLKTRSIILTRPCPIVAADWDCKSTLKSCICTVCDG